MKYLLILFLLLPSPIRAADLTLAERTVNGKVGKVITDKVISDTALYKPSLIGIDDKIMKGRAIVDAHRKMKVDSYKTVMTHEDRVVTNVTRLLNMREKLAKLGFKDEGDLMQKSKDADKAKGLAEKEMWK